MKTMKKSITISAILLLAVNAFAQKDVKLTINHMLGAEAFGFDKDAQNDMGHRFNLQRLEYYISGISIVHDGGTETKLPDIYILAKANKTDTFLLGNLDITTTESINFSIGVDPGVNNGDPAKWSSGHPLSPKSPSMHWGWSAGYRFVALEGKSGSNLAQEFQIHALGNKNYFKQNIPVKGKLVKGALVMSLNADYTKTVSGMDMNAGLVEHSENNEAATCLRLFQTRVFTNESGQGNTLSVNDLKVADGFKTYPNPSTGTVAFQVVDDRFLSGKLQVMNILGEVTKEATIENDLQVLTIDQPGLYFVSLSKNGLVSTEKVIIK